jgi:DNA-binding IclR family transcriptional regulator
LLEKAGFEMRKRVLNISKSEPGVGGSQTVDRALEVLQIIASEGRQVPLDEIVERSGLHKSIVYRLLRSLEGAAFVGRDPKFGGYTVAAMFLSLSVLTVSRIDLRRRSRPAMEEIVSRHGETVSLHIRSGDLRVCIDVVDGSHAIRRVVPVGLTLPVYAGETGRVLLSRLGEREIEPILTSAKAAGTDVTRLRADIQRARKQGYFIGIGVRTPDVGSISIPLHGSVGVLGALTISGPATRGNRASMRAALPSILKIVDPVVQALGASTPL